MNSSDQIERVLGRLQREASVIIEQLKAAGEWVPGTTTWEYRKSANFSYSRERQGPGGWSVETYESEDWLPVAEKLGVRLEASGIYSDLADAIRAKAPNVLDDRGMRMFQWQFHRSLVPPDPGQRNLRTPDDLLAQLRSDLEGGPMECVSEVRVSGLVILAQSVTLSIPGGRIHIRPLLQADVERPYRKPQWEGSRFLEDRVGTAILDIRVSVLQPADFQRMIHKACMLLSLFDASNVNYVQYGMSAWSFRDWGGGTIQSGRIPQAVRPLILEDSDIPSLRQFWHELWQSFPVDPFAKRNEGPATVAHSRYTEACTESRSTEYNMATAMMGLEGLLADGEPEISYRMAMRLARVCSLAELNPHAVYDTVRDGYRIRSVLVHGGYLDHRETQKYSRLHGSMEILLQKNLQYLRFMVTLWFVARLEKTKFLDLVDEAMWDTKRADELGRLISQYHACLGRRPRS
jgi:hypothetical protein